LACFSQVCHFTLRSPGQPTIGWPSQFFPPTLSQSVLPVFGSKATMPEFVCPPTITSKRPASRIGELPTPKNAIVTLKSTPVSRCQILFPLDKSRQTSLPSAPRV